LGQELFANVEMDTIVDPGSIGQVSQRKGSSESQPGKKASGGSPGAGFSPPTRASEPVPLYPVVRVPRCGHHAHSEHDVARNRSETGQSVADRRVQARMPVQHSGTRLERRPTRGQGPTGLVLGSARQSVFIEPDQTSLRSGLSHRHGQPVFGLGMAGTSLGSAVATMCSGSDCTRWPVEGVPRHEPGHDW